jgi:hypothetical protein
MGHQKSGIPCSDFNHSSWNRGSKFLDIREKAEFPTADVDAIIFVKGCKMITKACLLQPSATHPRF